MLCCVMFAEIATFFADHFLVRTVYKGRCEIGVCRRTAGMGVVMSGETWTELCGKSKKMMINMNLFDGYNVSNELNLSCLNYI